MTSTNNLISAAASMSDRYIAMIYDAIFFLLIIFLSAKLILFLNIDGRVAQYVFFVFLFLYDPLCVSLFRATPGHFLKGLRVVSTDSKNLNFFKSFVRYIVKITLGILSLITILGSKKQAIHDKLTSSYVVYKNKL
ncbi:RDD family protein [Leptospira perdikensis]|uniref:RDD family protein n=1 Tax=Leptospira perdikensis TaxID=2484948 RepID=A0A4R9JHK3_9LEPT|nr:RDD family protein [Leptospira perdikensis]TGL44376.1 RDD family protein [Leptospira perdikensis]